MAGILNHSGKDHYDIYIYHGKSVCFVDYLPIRARSLEVCIMNFKNEEAVSPVIGVILMVAITVILAAVIAAFVFGMTGNVQSTKNVAATAKQVGTDVVVTYQGGADQATVEYLAVNWKDHVYYSAKGTSASGGAVKDDTTGVSAADLKPNVGHVITIGGATPEADKVVVVAHFTDGSDQVVLDTTV